MDESLLKIYQLIPEKYRVTFMIIVIGSVWLTPKLGRAYYALTHNGGIRGVWCAIMFGTNTPQVKVIKAPEDKTSSQ